jgi:hypothetical protein
MPKQGVYVKGVSQALHREIKAQSARLGKTVSEVVTSALEDWLRRKAPEEDRESLQNNLAYEAVEDEIPTKHSGKYVAFERGQIVGAADTMEGLRAFMSDVDHRIILRVGEAPPKKKYLGGSSIRRAKS